MAKTKRNKHEERKLKRELVAIMGYVCIISTCKWCYNLQMHHIDGNPLNNTLQNVILVCGNHHNIIHNPPKLILLSKQEVEELTYYIRRLK